MKKVHLVLLTTLIVSALYVGIYILMLDDSTAMLDQAGNNSTQERKPLYWVEPMDPNYRRSEPGIGPMGMALVPVYEAADDSGITISAAIEQNLGVRTATVERRDLSRLINAVGYTRWDDSSLQMLYPRAEGWLEVFNLASEGDSVSSGEILYELFSPKLLSTQSEYLVALQSNSATLVNAATDRLVALGFTTAQITALGNSRQVSNRQVVRAEVDSLITHIAVRQGNYVEPDTLIATLASLDTIWVDSEVFESDAGEIEAGLTTHLSFAAFPDEQWTSQIDTVYPELDPVTRSLRVRMVVDNADHRLKPNMFAKVTIESKPHGGVLVVPREAVIQSGRGSHVILARGEGRFQPVPVRTGISSDIYTIITSGLSEGDRVVSSGQFLLDSEANGEQAMARLNSGADSANDAVPAAEIHATSGTVTAVNGAMVTIAHLPVASLNWPGMTMAFNAAQLDISAITAGSLVDFQFIQAAGGSYQLTAIVVTGVR